MARINISLPGHFSFSTKVTVRIDDINYGNHLGNDAILSIIHESRVRFLQHYGYSEMNIEGVGVIMADVAIVYKSEGFYGNEIEIKVTAVDFSRSGFDLYYLLINNTTGKDLAHGKTGMVCFDYEKRKIVQVPEEFKLKVSQ